MNAPDNKLSDHIKALGTTNHSIEGQDGKEVFKDTEKSLDSLDESVLNEAVVAITTELDNLVANPENLDAESEDAIITAMLEASGISVDGEPTEKQLAKLNYIVGILNGYLTLTGAGKETKIGDEDADKLEIEDFTMEKQQEIGANVARGNNLEITTQAQAPAWLEVVKDYPDISTVLSSEEAIKEFLDTKYSEALESYEESRGSIDKAVSTDALAVVTESLGGQSISPHERFKRALGLAKYADIEDTGLVNGKIAAMVAQIHDNRETIKVEPITLTLSTGEIPQITTITPDTPENRAKVEQYVESIDAFFHGKPQAKKYLQAMTVALGNGQPFKEFDEYLQEESDMNIVDNLLYKLSKVLRNLKSLIGDKLGWPPFLQDLLSGGDEENPHLSEAFIEQREQDRRAETWKDEALGRKFDTFAEEYHSLFSFLEDPNESNNADENKTSNRGKVSMAQFEGWDKLISEDKSNLKAVLNVAKEQSNKESISIEEWAVLVEKADDVKVTDNNIQIRERSFGDDNAKFADAEEQAWGTGFIDQLELANDLSDDQKLLLEKVPGLSVTQEKLLLGMNNLWSQSGEGRLRPTIRDLLNLKEEHRKGYDISFNDLQLLNDKAAGFKLDNGIEYDNGATWKSFGFDNKYRTMIDDALVVVDNGKNKKTREEVHGRGEKPDTFQLQAGAATIEFTDLKTFITYVRTEM